MCFFLTIAVPSENVNRVREVFARGFQTFQTENRHVTAALPADYTALLITSGMCSCDLYTRRQDTPEYDPTAHLRRKYEKRGWSESKIKRAIEQAKLSASNLSRPSSGFRADVVDGLEKICQIAGGIAVLVHWYDGDIETERLSLNQAHSCGCNQLRARVQDLSEDELLIAVARRFD